jgi:hypothetical protein
MKARVSIYSGLERSDKKKDEKTPPRMAAFVTAV